MKELEAANVTRGYDDYLMDYDKERRDRAKRRSEGRKYNCHF